MTAMDDGTSFIPQQGLLYTAAQLSGRYVLPTSVLDQKQGFLSALTSPCTLIEGPEKTSSIQQAPHVIIAW